MVSSSGKERRRARDTESTSSTTSSHSSAPFLDRHGYLDIVISTRSTYLIYEVGSKKRSGRASAGGSLPVAAGRVSRVVGDCEPSKGPDKRSGLASRRRAPPDRQGEGR